MQKVRQRVLVLNFDVMASKRYAMYVFALYFEARPYRLISKDIRGLLEEWVEYIAGCERIWIRASISNRKIFYDYDAAPFSQNDERLRTFPFPTRRPVSFSNILLVPISEKLDRHNLNCCDVSLNWSAPKSPASRKRNYVLKMRPILLHCQNQSQHQQPNT